MIGMVVKILDNIKMSAAQWLIVSVTALVGGLVVALKIQGGRLHRAQIELLAHQRDDVEKASAAKTKAAYDVYSDALDQFFRAGGKF
jgi:hypothetical protein